MKAASPVLLFVISIGISCGLLGSHCKHANRLPWMRDVVFKPSSILRTPHAVVNLVLLYAGINWFESPWKTLYCQDPVPWMLVQWCRFEPVSASHLGRTESIFDWSLFRDSFQPKQVEARTTTTTKINSVAFDRHLSAKLLPNLRIQDFAWSAQRISTAVNLDFLDPQPLLFHSSSFSIRLWIFTNRQRNTLYCCIDFSMPHK
jgi:hypothetical protein